MIAIGVGCRKNCPAGDIVALVRETLERLPRGVRPSGLFSISAKGEEAGLRAAAASLDLPLTFLDHAALARVADRSQSHCKRVEAIFGLPSVAETAALAGAGAGAVLLVTRRSSPTATCAIAGPSRMATPP